jgi:hypothetical protein
MKRHSAFLLASLGAIWTAQADIQTDWAYHAIGNGSRTTELVPGEPFAFLANGTEQIPDGDSVTLYVLTAKDFAGEMDEQVFVRWWDGYMSHWIMGTWLKNVGLDAARPEARFRGLPAEGAIDLDLWQIEIPAWITQPGENFYAIQLKGYAPDDMDERYLLRRPGGDFCHSNNFGQVWSASEEFDGQDWQIQILP